MAKIRRFERWVVSLGRHFTPIPCETRAKARAIKREIAQQGFNATILDIKKGEKV